MEYPTEVERIEIDDKYAVGSIRRMKVHNGWLVFWYMQSITFVYDPKHEWNIKK